MAKGNKMVKVMAILALFGIIIGIVGTGLLIIFGNSQPYESNQTLTPEQYLELQELIKSNSGIINESATGTELIEVITNSGSELTETITNSGTIDIINNGSGEIK